MRKILASLIAAVFAASLAAPAFAGPAAYVTAPFDTINASVNSAVQNVNLTGGQFGILAAGTASSNAATINSTRTLYTTASLTTAASTLAATQTETNSTVTAASIVLCGTTGYAGPGVPVVVNVVPAAGSFTFAVQNVSTSTALNAVVNVACMVYN